MIDDAKVNICNKLVREEQSSICGFKFLSQTLVGDSHLRYQMTAAVTEQNEGCLELIIVKEACFFEA